MTSEARPAGERKVVRRPRNRGEQILKVAADQFQAHGFHNVTLANIASEVGITVAALYRHHPSKQALLDRVVEAELVDYSRSTDGLAPDDLSGIATALIDRALGRRGVAALAYSHQRECSPDVGRTVVAAVRDKVGEVEVALGHARPDLQGPDTRLVARGLLAVCDSAARYHTRMRQDRQRTLVQESVQRLITVDFGRLREISPPPAVYGDSRRDQILAAMVRLTRSRGFRGVTMDDVAAELGLAVSSLYNHFDSKDELLAAALAGAAARLDTDLKSAVATDATQAPVEVMQRYIEFALADGSPLTLLLTERSVLSPEILRVQRHHVDNWSAILPGPPTDARIRLQSALGVVNAVAQAPTLVASPGAAAKLLEMSLRVLDVADFYSA